MEHQGFNVKLMKSYNEVNVFIGASINSIYLLYGT